MSFAAEMQLFGMEAMMVHAAAAENIQTTAPEGRKKRNFLISFFGVYAGLLWSIGSLKASDKR